MASNPDDIPSQSGHDGINACRRGTRRHIRGIQCPISVGDQQFGLEGIVRLHDGDRQLDSGSEYRSGRTQRRKQTGRWILCSCCGISDCRVHASLFDGFDGPRPATPTWHASYERAEQSSWRRDLILAGSACTLVWSNCKGKSLSYTARRGSMGWVLRTFHRFACRSKIVGIVAVVCRQSARAAARPSALFPLHLDGEPRAN